MNRYFDFSNFDVDGNLTHVCDEDKWLRDYGSAAFVTVMRKGNHDITFKDDNINLACHVGNIEFPMFPGQVGNIPTLTFYGGCFLATVNVVSYCDPYMYVAIHDLDSSSV